MADISQVDGLIKTAREVDSPHVDLSGVFGLDSPLLVGVDDLHAALWKQEAPAVSIHYENAAIVVKKEGGAVMATLEVRL